MRYLRIYEDFIQSEFLDVFGIHLLRGVNVDKIEYIDDPKNRRVRIGTLELDDYRLFLENYSKLGLQDPTKSVHFYLNPTDDQKSAMSSYGKTFRVIPERNAKFSFSRELRNGGLGSTWYFVSRCLFDWLKLDPNLDNSHEIELNPNYKKYFKSKKDLKDLCELHNIYQHNKSEFVRLVTAYQQWLIDEEVVGNLTYDQLLKLAKESNEPLQIWTESRVLHKLEKI